MTDLITTLESEVTDLATRDGITVDDAALLLTKIDAAQKRLKEVKEQLEDFLITWMPANNVRELRLGDEVRYVGPKSREKCRNIPATVHAIFEAVGGDYDQFCDCLSSSAIKYGAAKKVLGDKYREHFDTITEMDLLTGKPTKVLKSFNEKFIR